MLVLFFIITISLGSCEENKTLDCLRCLAKVKPLNTCTDDEGSYVCGNLRLTERFFIDCQRDLDGSHDYRSCALDPECSVNCVRAYHRKYTPSCLSALNKQELSCYDYTVMHFHGPVLCSQQPSNRTQQIINNMTNLCGCETVYNGPCPTTPPEVSNKLVLYIVPAVCGGVLVILIIVTVVCCVLYRKRKRKVSKDIESRIRELKWTKTENSLTHQESIEDTEANAEVPIDPDIAANLGKMELTIASPEDRNTPLALINGSSSPNAREPSGNENIYEQAIPVVDSYRCLQDMTKINDLRGKNLSLPATSKEKNDLYINKAAIELSSSSQPTHSRPNKPPVPVPRGVSTISSLPVLYLKPQVSNAPSALYVQDIVCDGNTD